MVRRSQLTTILIVGLVLVSVVSPAAAYEEADAVQVLEDGEELYLVFGADLGDQTLEEWVAEHAETDGGDQNASTEVIQYQDVSQLNLNVQENAVAISIDGGEATAIQQSEQSNVNSQTGDATATNDVRGSDETTFANVDTVTIVFADGGDNRFSGWAVTDDDGGVTEVRQHAVATVTQNQTAEQANYNNQSMAIAIAESGSEATAVQQSSQSNENWQIGYANASNLYEGDADGTDQTAVSNVTQVQTVSQLNANEQAVAVAIAVGTNSSATAVQTTDQENLNVQYGDADATNLIVDLAGMNVATAGGTTDGVEHSHRTSKQTDGEKNHDGNGVDQNATATVTQYQDVEQINFNVQSSAVAVATNGSEASAIQLANQQNYNAQVAYADALNQVEDRDIYKGVVVSERTAVTLDGSTHDSNPDWAIDYDSESHSGQDVEQNATAEIQQLQFVSQLNVNDQQSAIALAQNGGTASAQQITLQVNENYQFASAEAYDAVVRGDGDTGAVLDALKQDIEQYQKTSDSLAAENAGHESDQKKTGDTGNSYVESEGQPGFGVVVALIALLGGAMVATRRSA